MLSNLYDLLKDKVDFYFDSPVTTIAREGEGYRVTVGETDYTCDKCIVSVGRRGSKWMESVCRELNIETKSNRVDIGVRVELPAEIFKHLTDELYESKIVYKTEKYQDLVRTFCMNPKGAVVTENTNGIVTVNGHSYEDPAKQTENTNFALLVSNHFTEPFDEPYRYGKHIASLSNMLAGGVLVQRFGDLVKGVRTNEHRLGKSFTRPTLTAAVPGDLSLALPKRQLDDIIEMIYALDKLAPGTAKRKAALKRIAITRVAGVAATIGRSRRSTGKGIARTHGVVARTFLLIRKHGVGLGNLFKLFLGIRLFVDVRMELAGLLLEGLLNITRGGVLGDTQNLVVIFFVHRRHARQPPAHSSVYIPVILPERPKLDPKTARTEHFHRASPGVSAPDELEHGPRRHLPK